MEIYKKQLNSCPECKCSCLSFSYADGESWAHCTKEEAVCYDCGYTWIQPHEKNPKDLIYNKQKLFEFTTDVTVKCPTNKLKEYNKLISGKERASSKDPSVLKKAREKLKKAQTLKIHVIVMSDGSLEPVCD